MTVSKIFLDCPCCDLVPQPSCCGGDPPEDWPARLHLTIEPVCSCECLEPFSVVLNYDAGLGYWTGDIDWPEGCVGVAGLNCGASSPPTKAAACGFGSRLIVYDPDHMTLGSPTCYFNFDLHYESRGGTCETPDIWFETPTTTYSDQYFTCGGGTACSIRFTLTV